MHEQCSSHGEYGRSDSAVCDIRPLESGWRVQVEMPRRLADEERVEILNWLASYRAEIRQPLPAQPQALVHRGLEVPCAVSMSPFSCALPGWLRLASQAVVRQRL